MICIDHRCASPGGAAPAPVPTTVTDARPSGNLSVQAQPVPAAEPSRCTELLGCADGVCDAGLCHPVPALRGKRDRVMLGALYEGVFMLQGLAQIAGNSIGLEVAYTGNEVRWHGFLGLDSYGAGYGFKLEPVVLGLPFTVYRGRAQIEVEPAISPLGFEYVSGDDDYLLALSASVWAALVVEFHRTYLMVEPVGVDLRYFTYLGAPAGGFSGSDLIWSWRASAAAGLRF